MAYNYKRLTPFKRCVLQNFPFIEQDFDALTNYGLLCKVVEYLNIVIDSQNTVTANIEVLNQWFENLDVQDEVDKKLDEMAEDGRLADIIADYIQLKGILAYNTVADMKSAENLVNGSFAETYGFYANGDGGGAKYKVRTISNVDVIDDMTLFALNDPTLVAELVLDCDMNVNQFGAKGNGTDDDTVAINKALSTVNSVIFKANSTYMVKGYEDGQSQGGTTGLTETTGLIVKSNSIIDLNKATIKIISNTRQNYHAFTVRNVSNVTIKNGTIIGDNDTHTGTGEWGYGVAVCGSSDIILDSLTIKNCWGDGINLNNATGSAGSDNKNIYIKNCICDDNRRQGMSIESGENIYVENSQFINTGSTSFTAPGYGVDIEPATFNVCQNINFNDCIFTGNYAGGIESASPNVKYLVINNCIIKNNIVGAGLTNPGNLKIDRGAYITVTNCEISSDGANNYVYGRTSISGSEENHNYITFENNRFVNQLFLFRPIDCDYVDYNFKNNTVYLDNDANTQCITFENQPDYITNNLHISANICGNNFRQNPTVTNMVLYWIHCIDTAGINKIIISDNEFTYGNRYLITGIPTVVKNNIFSLSSGIAFNVYGSQTCTMLFKDNAFYYPNANTSTTGLIEDYTTAFNIYALNNVVFKDTVLNLNDGYSAPLTHTTIKMFVYERSGSVSDGNKIY